MCYSKSECHSPPFFPRGESHGNYLLGYFRRLLRFLSPNEQNTAGLEAVSGEQPGV